MGTVATLGAPWHRYRFGLIGSAVLALSVIMSAAAFALVAGACSPGAFDR